MDKVIRDIRRRVELNEPLRTIDIGQIVKGDMNADRFVLELLENGKPLDLGEYSVSGMFLNAIGVDVPITGEVEGNVLTATLGRGCYDVRGMAGGFLRIANGDATVIRTVIRFTADVLSDGTGIVYDPDKVIGNIAELLAKIAAMEDATSDAREATREVREALGSEGNAQVAAIRQAGAEQVAAAKTEGAAQMVAIEQKGAATLKTIPADYTKLANDVGSLKDTIDDSFEIEILSKNLFNGVSDPGYLLEDGTLKVSGDWRTTDYIYVHGQESVAASYAGITSGTRTGCSMYYMTSYDKNKNPVEYVGDYTQAKTVYAPPLDVYYIRFCYHSDSYTDVMVEPGTNRTGYEPYAAARLVKDSDYLRSGKKDVGYDDLEDALASIFVENWTKIPLVFSVENEMFNSSSGQFMAYDSVDHTDYLDCESIKKIRVTGTSYYQAVLVVFFDAEKNVISHFPEDGTGGVVKHTNVVVNIPENAAYMVVFTTEERTNTATSVDRLNGYTANVQTTTPRWADKKWVCVGDSLTEKNSRTTKNYHDYVAESTGITVVNMGVSGTGYARKADSGNAFYQRIANVPTDADVVTIFGSGNDLGAGLELGTPADTGTATLCGCINTTIDNLISILPAVSLGIVSPTPWVDCPPSSTSNAMAKYAEALETICEYRSIPFLDLYHCSNLRPWTEEGRAACYTKDDGNGVHPDETGHKLIAPRFKAFLETLLM